ncbi:hypothetical protein [Rhodococcus sp. H29-C3]|uniref:hypothetical protein n=1 Tax=Rhodococcus sp. H29-C3 TaxID=3046307 RepID=UPI0024B8DFB4|nr:hypothetical protein [Rhodococcus sp. H29-C3]MDJ0361539.1 hypothetical protein [Rhodococcus sp. H29-C3]
MFENHGNRVGGYVSRFEAHEVPTAPCSDCNATFRVLSENDGTVLVNVIHAPTCPFYGGGCNRAARRSARKSGGKR